MLDLWISTDCLESEAWNKLPSDLFKAHINFCRMACRRSDGTLPPLGMCVKTLRQPVMQLAGQLWELQRRGLWTHDGNGWHPSDPNIQLRERE